MVESASLGSFRVVPDYRIFAVSLTFAISSFQERMAVCGNPECEEYFFKARKTQKFCDRPNCLAYGQRTQKNRWWEKHGNEWRKKNKANRTGEGREKKRK
jgi:hypothetical protein